MCSVHTVLRFAYTGAFSIGCYSVIKMFAALSSPSCRYK